MRTSLPVRAAALLVAAAAVAAGAAATGHAGDGAAPPRPQRPEVTPQARDAAIAKACSFLDAGLWKLHDNNPGSPFKAFTAATAGWAYFLVSGKSAGPVPSRAGELERVRSFLDRYEEGAAGIILESRKLPSLSQVPGLGLIQVNAGTQFVWGFSAAEHFHAESLARGVRAKEARSALQLVVRALERAQQPDGGWGHDDASRPGMGRPMLPVSGSEPYPTTFVVASQCALAALANARRALAGPPPASLGRARDYVVSAQNGDGTFPCDPRHREAKARPKTAAPEAVDIENIARTSGAAYALIEAGAQPGDPALVKAFAAIDGHVPWFSESNTSATFGLEYAALLARSRGGDAWAAFRAEFFPRILEAQGADGSFVCACRAVSPETACDSKSQADDLHFCVTAIHLLILALDGDESLTLPKLAPSAPPPK